MAGVRAAGSWTRVVSTGCVAGVDRSRSSLAALPRQRRFALAPAAARPLASRAPLRLAAGAVLAPAGLAPRGLGDPDRDPLLDRSPARGPAWRIAALSCGHVVGRRALRRLPLLQQPGDARLLRRPRCASSAWLGSSGSPPPPAVRRDLDFQRRLLGPWPPRACLLDLGQLVDLGRVVSNIVVDHWSRVCRSSVRLRSTSRATGSRLVCCWYWSRTICPAIACWASSFGLAGLDRRLGRGQVASAPASAWRPSSRPARGRPPARRRVLASSA